MYFNFVAGAAVVEPIYQPLDNSPETFNPVARLAIAAVS